MVPPDGARTKRIPSLSWNSVVDSDDQPTPASTDAPAVLEEPITLAPLALDLSSPAAAAAAPVIEAPIAFEPLHLGSSEELGMTTSPGLAPPAAPPIPASPVPASFTDEAITIRTTPPAVIVPALGDVTSGPDRVVPDPAPPPAPMPAAAPPPAPVHASTQAQASEPAPAPDSASDSTVASIQVPPVTEALPQIREATPVVAHVAPLLPSVAPAVPRAAVAASFEFEPASVASAPVRQPQRRSGGRALKLMATLVVLGGLVAAGVVFGQPYLFPGEWDSATARYAEAVEIGREVEFAESLAIVAEPTDDFDSRLGAQLAPLPADELVRWRALGLLSGTVDDAAIARQLAGWQDALYSTADGQVYHDLGAAGAELDARLVQEMTAASLDQQFSWSAGQAQRTLDAAAATSAEVLRQSRALQQSSAFDAELPPVPSEAAATLPPVVAYRLLAPHVFAEFDASIGPDDGTNPLAGLGANGPGLLGRETSVVAAGSDPNASDAAGLAQDRSFWYLVFAAYLDAGTAHLASEAVVESSLTVAPLGATECVSATFSGGGVDQTATLRSALTAWAAAAPAEMSSSFQVLPDGALQLVSCDPGAGFDVAARPDVAQELIAWRTAKLATEEAIAAVGGGEAELADAWNFVQTSPVAFDLMALPASSTPAEIAATARTSFNALFVPAG